MSCSERVALVWGASSGRRQILRADLAYNREMQILAGQERIEQEVTRQEQARRIQEVMSRGGRPGGSACGPVFAILGTSIENLGRICANFPACHDSNSDA